MLSLSCADVIAALTEDLLGFLKPRQVYRNFSDLKDGIWFRIDASCNDTKTHKRQVLHILITEHKEVFYSVSDLNFKLETLTWSFETRHESCWRSLSFITQFYFQLADKTNSNTAPNKLNWHTVFYPGDYYVRVKCKTTDDLIDRNKRTLLKIERVPNV